VLTWFTRAFFFGVMVAARGESTEPVPLEKVARKTQSWCHWIIRGWKRPAGGNVFGRLMIFFGSTHVAAALAAPLLDPAQVIIPMVQSETGSNSFGRFLAPAIWSRLTGGSSGKFARP